MTSTMSPAAVTVATVVAPGATLLRPPAPPTHHPRYLVDLAGSERVLKSGVTGKELKEAQ